MEHSNQYNFINNQNDKPFKIVYHFNGEMKDFIVSTKILIQESEVIKNMAEEYPNDELSIMIPKEVHPNVIERYVEYLYYHSKNPKIWIEMDGIRTINDFYSDYEKKFFTSLTDSELKEIIHIGNFLDTKYFIKKWSGWIAKYIIPNKTVEELREFFNLEDDFTPEEKEVIRKENEWLN
jgi:S-phase kinase-associated protein 1